MALKYHATFADVCGNSYRVEILDDNYHAPSKEMELGGDGVVISRSGKKITEPIFSMGATIQVWCNENFEYADLFATAEQTNQVVIGRKDRESAQGTDPDSYQIIFRGWIEPSLYEEEYMKPPYLISIPASDGLAALSNYYPSGFSETRPVTLFSIIRKCLSYTGMNLPVNIACGLNHGDLKDNRLFEKTFVELDSLRTYKDGTYEYDDASTLLEDILKPFSCRIYQSNDEWYIERIKNRATASVTWIRYTSSSDSTSVVSHATAALDSPEYPFVDNAATLQVDAGYGKQTVKADGDTWDSVILNNFEEEITYVNNVFYPFHVPNKRWYMRGEGITPVPFKDEWGIKQGLEIQHNSTIGDKTAVWQTSRVTARGGDEISISFKCTIKRGSKSATDGLYKIRIQSKIKESGTDDLSTLKWVKGKNDETFYQSDDILGRDYKSEAEYSLQNDWKEGLSKPLEISLTIKVNPFLWISCINEISFSILPVLAKNGDQWMSQSEYVEATIIGDVEVKVIEKEEYDNTFTATINRSQLRKAEDIDIRFWTLPSTSLIIDTTSNSTLPE